MIFGSVSSFAIEADAIGPQGEDSRTWASFRYWVEGRPIGNCEDLILLRGSAKYAVEFLETAERRVDDQAPAASAVEMFARVYDRFYAEAPSEYPTLRERFHLDDISMESTRDRYGIVAVASSAGMVRVLAKDLRTDCVIADASLPIVKFNEALRTYADWALSMTAERV